MTNCPLGLTNPDCKKNGCEFAKEGLCDFPYIGADKCEIITETKGYGGSK